MKLYNLLNSRFKKSLSNLKVKFSKGHNRKHNKATWKAYQKRLKKNSQILNNSQLIRKLRLKLPHQMHKYNYHFNCTICITKQLKSQITCARLWTKNSDKEKFKNLFPANYWTRQNMNFISNAHFTLK